MIYINETTAIMFSHVTVPGDSRYPADWTLAQNHRATVCDIVSLENGVINEKLASGIARCNPLDNFNKEKGRKDSLTKALSQLTTSKSLRKTFWIAYHNRQMQPGVQNYV